MKKSIILLFCAFLVGCAVEPEKKVSEENNHIEESEEKISGSFMLKADPAYIKGKKADEVEVYIIEQDNNQVYVKDNLGQLTEEQLEKMKEMEEESESMTAEEIDEVIGIEEAEDPIHEIKYLDTNREMIILEYEDKKIEFIALSPSVYETEAGVRYGLVENTSISAYESSLYAE